MPDKQPPDQPQPKSGQGWDEVSVQDIEQKLSTAADLAYELAGDVGASGDQPQPKYRDTSGLESIESALDVELKQLEHLVDRTKEQLSDEPPAAVEKPAGTAAVPDFMSEFLSDEPATVVPEPRGMAPAAAEVSAPAEIHSERRGHSTDTLQKPGLVGVGSLGRSEPRKPTKPEKPKVEPTKVVPRVGWAKRLEGPAYMICGGAVQLLELIDRPFARLSPAIRRGMSVTAIAAFCVCLLVFVLSLLMS